MEEVLMENYHLCNDVMSLIVNKRCIGYSYEDNNYEALDDAIEQANWLEQNSPGKYVLVHTGDYITHKDPSQGSLETETYDPYFYYYLIPKPYWETIKVEVIERDKAWRKEKEKIANHVLAIYE